LVAAETSFLLRLEKSDVPCFERLDEIFEFLNVAISFFFAPLAHVSPTAQLLIRGLRTFSRLGGEAVLCFERVRWDSNIRFAIRNAVSRDSRVVIRGPRSENREGVDAPETCFLLRLEIVTRMCFEWVTRNLNLACVAISRHGGQGLFFAFWGLEIRRWMLETRRNTIVLRWNEVDRPQVLPRSSIEKSP
jgi:hypothetical protein